MPEKAEKNEKATIRVKPWTWEPKKPVARSLGPHLEGAAGDYADGGDPETVRQGAEHRFAREPIKTSKRMMKKLRSFVRIWCRKHLTRLVHIPSFEEWLATTGYDTARKEELRLIMEEWRDLYDDACPGNRKTRARFQRRMNMNKSFVKIESYLTAKFARWINSRSDAFKVAVGPYFKAIEEVVYNIGQDGSYPFRFIKHVPVEERFDYIDSLFNENGGTLFVETDHTAFEAHMTPEVMRAVELQVYGYMLGNFPKMFSVIKSVLTGWNYCRHKLMTIVIEGIRMSGEMCTSLGNGLTNLLVFLFICHIHDLTPMAGIVEGDDGLFALTTRAPTPEEFLPIGMELKCVESGDWTALSFCGMTFERSSRTLLKDPWKVLVKFGWTHSQCMDGGDKVMCELLRAKAFSLACEAHGTPILSSLARYAERITRGNKVRVDSRDAGGIIWKREELRRIDVVKKKMNDFFLHEPSDATRAKYEQKFGVSVQDQLAIEDYLLSKNDRLPISNPIIEKHVLNKYPHAYEVGETHIRRFCKRPVGSERYFCS